MLGCWKCIFQPQTPINGPRSSRDQSISPERLHTMINKWLINTILRFNLKFSQPLFIYLFKEKSNFRGKTQPSSKRGKANEREMAQREQACGNQALTNIFMQPNRITGVNEWKPKLHLNDPPRKWLRWSIRLQPQRYLQPSRRVNSVSLHFTSRFFPFFFVTPKFTNCTRLTRGDAAQSDTVQRQNKCGSEVALTLIRLTNPALKSTWASACLRALFSDMLLLQRWTTRMCTSGKCLSARLLDFKRRLSRVVVVVVVAALLTSVADVQYERRSVRARLSHKRLKRLVSWTRRGSN